MYSTRGSALHLMTPKTQCELTDYGHSPYSIAPPKRASYISADDQDSEWAAARSIHKVLRARERRSKFFKASLFADPAWDMLLELLLAEIEQVRLSIGSLCIGSQVPATTALRWIGKLQREGLIVKRCDPLDARRIYVGLSPTGSRAMRAYFGISEKLHEGQESGLHHQHC